MKLPNGQVIRHAGAIYDPQKAHEYYIRTRKLKGRKKGSADETSGLRTTAAVPTAERKKALLKKIEGLEKKLKELEALIAKKEKAAKESVKETAKKAAKPDTTAEKSEKARDAKKYRDKHQQEIKSKAKKAADKAGSGGSSQTSTKGKSLKDLKMLATKVRGQIQTAKAKLGSL